MRRPAKGGYSPAVCGTSSIGAGFGSRTAAVELPGDLLTPFGVFCLLDQQQPPGGDAFLFEGALGRYSYVGVGNGAPRLTFAAGTRSTHPLEALRTALEDMQSEKPADLPPLCGGYVGYLGWAAAGWSEKIPQRLGPDPFFPEADLLHVTELVSFDHRQGRAWAVATGDDPGSRAEALARRVLAVFGDAKADVRWPDALRKPAAQSLAARMFGAKRPVRGHPEPRPLGGGERAFKAAVKKALEYIYAGDIFQVVLSQRFELPDCDGFSLYRTLRAASPAPYHFYLRLGGRELFGASPELLVEVDQGLMSVRPIAGTRRRGGSAKEDEKLERELKADPKERAEHTMLVDLGRNDVGRVSQIGTVRLPRLMEIERFSHVMHLVSEVNGKLEAGLGSVDAFASAFPAGTLSGAPKIRALQIIDELETVQRGPYGGGVGWFSAAGDVQLAIAIRTLFRSGGRLFAHAGAGIVADSTPEREWQEVLAKVRASVGAAYGAVAGRDEAVAEAATR
ncbi:MAG: anthranilate synthase component I family protein [Deltaproteobacteria bacterium]|nr:MAG: anthranilate synthase component I family protein [Deltaproteobacteria bacterium]TMB35807.1 MAG: anthranilate synthase component I family protein [Deltaproteobacteria bacterium]